MLTAYPQLDFSFSLREKKKKKKNRLAMLDAKIFLFFGGIESAKSPSHAIVSHALSPWCLPANETFYLRSSSTRVNRRRRRDDVAFVRSALAPNLQKIGGRFGPFSWFCLGFRDRKDRCASSYTWCAEPGAFENGPALPVFTWDVLYFSPQLALFICDGLDRTERGEASGTTDTPVCIDDSLVLR